MADHLNKEDVWPAGAGETDINRVLVGTSDYITTNATFYIIDGQAGMVEWYLIDLDRVIEDLQQFRQMLVDAGRMPKQRQRSG